MKRSGEEEEGGDMKRPRGGGGRWGHEEAPGEEEEGGDMKRPLGRRRRKVGT